MADLDILASLSKLVDSDLISSAATVLGESPGGVEKAAGGIIPTLLSGLIDKADDEVGFSGLFNLLSAGGNARFLDNPTQLLSGSNAAATSATNTLLGGLFGNKQSNVLDGVAQHAGIGGAAVKSLMGMIAPMVMGYFAKLIGQRGLNAAGLSQLLRDQRPGILGAVPAALSSLLGFAAGAAGAAADAVGDVAGAAADLAGDAVDVVGDAAGAVAGAAAGAAGAAVEMAGDAVDAVGDAAGAVAGAAAGAAGAAVDMAGDAVDAVGDAAGAAAHAVGDAAGAAVDVASDAASGLGRLLVPLLLLAALIFGGWMFMRGCGDDMKNAGEAVVDTTVAAGEAVGDKVGDVAGAVGDTAAAAGEAVGDAVDAVIEFFTFDLPNGVKIKGAENGVEKNLVGFLSDDGSEISEDTWYEFDRITFKTGSAEVDMEKSGDQISNIQQILKAFPSVKIKIGGYTDNTGSRETNMKLSQDRADAVKAAIAEGDIDGGRIETEGYGPEHPVCPANDTEECKQQNRRIAVRVTAK